MFRKPPPSQEAIYVRHHPGTGQQPDGGAGLPGSSGTSPTPSTPSGLLDPQYLPGRQRQTGGVSATTATTTAAGATATAASAVHDGAKTRARGLDRLMDFLHIGQHQPAAAEPAGRNVERMLAESYGDSSSTARLLQATRTYFARFDGLGDSFPRLVNALAPGQLRQFVEARRCYGAMSQAQMEKLFNERDVTNIAQKTTYKSSNNEILGCGGSYLSTPEASQAGLLEPGMQMSWLMPTLMSTPDGSVRPVTIMAVTAPALDTPRQPEWGRYVDANGRLDEVAYRKALQTIASHVVQGAADSGTPRAVLTAFGMGAFLHGLEKSEQVKAMTVGYEVFCDMIQKLRTADRPVEVAYSDLKASSPFWDSVNLILMDRGQPPVPWTGRIPGDWVRDNDMIVDPADQHSLSGNGCRYDRSGDGALGTETLIHCQHMIGCQTYSIAAH